MFPVTFYSYKGGVGRTMALLNVASQLMADGRKVVMIDFDLEAPGLGHSTSTRRAEASGGPLPGVSDFVLDRLKGEGGAVTDYGHDVVLPGGSAFLVPSGTRASELARRVFGIVENLGEPSAEVFRLLLSEIDLAKQPDFILIDSRTGRADIAGVCAMDLPRVLVAVCGLSEQNILGMADALETIWSYHDAEELSVLTLLAVGPVPTIGRAIRPSSPLLAGVPEGSSGSGLDPLVPMAEALIRRRIELLSARVGARVQERFGRVQQYFPEVSADGLMHEILYDPLVPFEDELVKDPKRPLYGVYRRLADVLRKAAGDPIERLTGGPLPEGIGPLLSLMRKAEAPQ